MQVNAQSSIKATLFGDFRIEAPDGDIIALTNRRASLLFAILCIEPGHSMDREALARLLWPDRFVPQAKASLRQCILKLQRKLMEYGVDALVISRVDVTLQLESLRSDLGALEAATAAGDTDRVVDQLLSIGSRPLLQGVSLNPSFDEWLAKRRTHVDARLRSVLSETIRSAAKPTAERLIEAARARFPSYRAFNQITHQATLALLPFPQTDAVGGSFFLADGILDELSTRLAGIQGIGLIGRTSVNAVAAKRGTLTEIASELGVSHFIEGEVRRRNQEIEIRIALISGQTGTEIWSDRLTGTIEHFFDGRKIIGANVIAAICGALGLTASPAPSRKMTSNREAYALYLQGRAMIQRFSGADVMARGKDFYEQALELDPGFAECWTALADAHIMTAAITPSLERLEQSANGREMRQTSAQARPRSGSRFFDPRNP